MSRYTWALFCPCHVWLVKLADGWQLPELVVQPMAGHHGFYSVLLTREDEPA